MDIYPRRTEKETTIADAQSSLGKTPQERMAMTCDLLRTIEILWANLSPAEQDRRRRIHRQLHALPDRWWQNVNPQAMIDHDAAARQAR